MSRFQPYLKFAFVIPLATTIACTGNVNFKAAPLNTKSMAAPDPWDPPVTTLPGNTIPATTPTTDPGSITTTTLPGNVTTTLPGSSNTTTTTTPGSNGTNARCGGGDPNLYTGYTDIVKAQPPVVFKDYNECQATRAAYFGNAYTCSKMVSATIFGCLPKADFSGVVMEIDLALPILKSTGKMEVPYDYILSGVPNCTAAVNFLNTFSSNLAATSGNFTNSRANIRSECLNSTDVLIHVLSIE